MWAFENIDNQNGWNDLQCKLVAMLHRSDFQWNFNVNKWSLTYAVNALICRVGLGVLHRITHEVRLQVFMLVTGSHVVHTNTNNSIKILLPYCKVTNCVTQCDYPFLLGFHGGYWTDCHLGFDTSRILHCQWCLHTQHNRSGHTFSHTHCSDSDTDCSVIDPSANPYITVLNHLMDCDNAWQTHEIFTVLRYTRRAQISSMSWRKPAITQRHSCFHYKGPQRNASLKI